MFAQLFDRQVRLIREAVGAPVSIMTTWQYKISSIKSHQTPTSVFGWRKLGPVASERMESTWNAYQVQRTLFVTLGAMVSYKFTVEEIKKDSVCMWLSRPVKCEKGKEKKVYVCVRPIRIPSCTAILDKRPSGSFFEVEVNTSFSGEHILKSTYQPTDTLASIYCDVIRKMAALKFQLTDLDLKRTQILAGVTVMPHRLTHIATFWKKLSEIKAENKAQAAKCSLPTVHRAIKQHHLKRAAN